MQQRFTSQIVPIVDIHVAQQEASSGHLDGAIELARIVLDDLFDSGGAIWTVLATIVLVEALLRRGTDEDGRVANFSRWRGWQRCRPIPASCCTRSGCCGCAPCSPEPTAMPPLIVDFRDRYRDMARTLGFEGHMQWSEAMP